MEDVEIDEQAHAPSTELYVRKQLCFVNWRERFDSLHLDYYKIFHQQVNSVTDIKLNSLINDWQCNLGEHVKATYS